LKAVTKFLSFTVLLGEWLITASPSRHQWDSLQSQIESRVPDLLRRMYVESATHTTSCSLNMPMPSPEFARRCFKPHSVSCMAESLLSSQAVSLLFYDKSSSCVICETTSHRILLMLCGQTRDWVFETYPVSSFVQQES